MSPNLTPSMRRSATISMLRDTKQWPAGFSWNFEQCSTCAIGLYCKTFENRTPKNVFPSFALNDSNEMWHIMNTLGLPDLWTAFHIFGYSYPCPFNKVTPHMVANRLEMVHKKLEFEEAKQC